MITEIKNLIGNTPLFKLNSCHGENSNIYAKLEGQNIGGSIKDRVALALIEDLEKKNLIKQDTMIFEPSSGNTGIGLAMIGAARNYKVRIMLPENATPERVALLKFFGTQVEFCSKEDWKGDTAIKKCKALAKNDKNLVMPNQYENPVCVDVHRKTTGAEILRQCPSITHLVATIGTGGTITGVAQKLKREKPGIKIIGVEIGENSSIPGPRNIKTYVPPIINFKLIDKRVMIEDEEAVFLLHKKLATEEGLFCGISSAATLYVAKQIANENPGISKEIVCIFPDRGDRYLSKLLNN